MEEHRKKENITGKSHPQRETIGEEMIENDDRKRRAAEKEEIEGVEEKTGGKRKRSQGDIRIAF